MWKTAVAYARDNNISRQLAEYRAKRGILKSRKTIKEVTLLEIWDEKE
jgi:hypothetical protein